MSTAAVFDLLDGGPLLADGRATSAGIEIAEHYREVKDQIAVLEKEQVETRSIILDATAAFPGVKSFPAGDLVIRVTEQSRETVNLTNLKKGDPDLYEALVAGGFITKTTSHVLSVR